MPVRIHHLPKKPLIVLQLTDTEEDRVRDSWTGCWCLENSGMPHVRAALHDAILSGILPIRTYAISAACPKPDVRKLEAPRGCWPKGLGTTDRNENCRTSKRTS